MQIKQKSQLHYIKFRTYKDKSQVNNDIFSEWQPVFE